MKLQRRYLLSVLGIMLNNLLFASFYPLAKFMMVQLDALSFMCCAIFLMAAPVGLLLFLWQRKLATPSLLQRGILLGACFAFLIITQALALNYTTATETAFFPSLNGLVAATITVVILKKRVERKIWIAVAFTIVGMCFLVTSSPPSLAHWRGDGIALLSQAGIYTTYIFLVDALMLSAQMSRDQTFFMIGTELSSAALIAAILFLLLGDWNTFRVLSWSDVFVMLYTGTANLVVPVLLFPFVQNGISALSAAFLYLLEPLVAAFLSFALLRERFSTVGYIGMAIVVAGAVVQALPSSWQLGSTRDRFLSFDLQRGVITIANVEGPIKELIEEDVPLQLKALFAAVLDVPAGQIHENSDFFEAGGDIELVALLSAIRQHFQVDVEPGIVYDHPILADLTVQIVAAAQHAANARAQEVMHS